MGKCEMQRIFDICFSVVALLILGPLLGCICLALKVTGEGHVFYFQDRVGRNNTNFRLIKFATMLYDSPNIGTGDITIRNDPRVLPFGKILRKSKINELPQLLNVIRGDMSLVGPRPLTRKNFNLYSEKTRQIISELRPGLTGVGSIIFRDEELYTLGETDPVKFYKEHIVPYKGNLEIWYFENKTLMLYFRLIFLTLLSVVLKNWKVQFRDKGFPVPEPTLLAKIKK